MYSTVVRQSHNWQRDPHNESGTHQAPPIVTTLWWTLFPMLYFTFPWLFWDSQFVLLNPFTFFTQPCNQPPLWQPSVCSLYLWTVFLLLVHLFNSLTPHTREIMWYLFFSVWFISLSIIPSRSFHAFANGKISFLWPSYISLCICTTPSLSTHLLMGTWVASISWLL